MTSYDNSSESKFPTVLGYPSGGGDVHVHVGGEGGVTVKWSSRSFSGISRVLIRADAPETPLLIGFVPVLDLAGLSHSLIPVISLVRPLSG